MSRISFGMLEAGYVPGDLDAFKKDGGKIRLYKDSPSQPSSMTQITQTYGPEFQPFASELMRRTGALASQPYERYQYNRIAGFDPMQLQSQQAAANMRVAPEIGTASGLATSAANRALNIKYDPARFQEERVAAERAAAERATTGRFTDPGVREAYMSPYMQGVVDIQKREAQRQADIARGQRGAQAVGAGAFGGSRQAIMEAEAQRNLAQQMGDIQARGSQAAFEQAAQQFQTDEARNLAMQQANVQAQLQAALANQQTGLAAALANQAKNLEAQQLTEQSRQFGAGLGLQGLQQQLAAASQLGQLGQQQYQQATGIIGAQMGAGAQQQGLKQRQLESNYQRFIDEMQYPYKQLEFMSNLIRGIPSTDKTTSTYTPFNQLAAFGGILGSGGGVNTLFGSGR